MEKACKSYIKVLLGAGLALLFFGVLPATIYAATLYFYPSSESYTADSAFTVDVYVSSIDQAINAASGVISFSQDKLEVVSFSKNDSIFSLWVQEPSFSNALGTINFEGIMLNPGFTGARGKILSAIFKAKAAGNSTLIFSSGSVLANDGKGTNILTDMGESNYILAESFVSPVKVPDKPEITSSTHSEQDNSIDANPVLFPDKIKVDKVDGKSLSADFDRAGVRINYVVEKIFLIGIMGAIIFGLCWCRCRYRLFRKRRKRG